MAHLSRQVDVYGWLSSFSSHIRSNFRSCRTFSNHRHLLLYNACQLIPVPPVKFFFMFVALRFFQAFGRAGMSTTGYVLIREIVGSEHQTVMSLAIQLDGPLDLHQYCRRKWTESERRRNNDLKLPDNKQDNEKKHSPTLLEVLKMTKMRKRLFIMIFVWYETIFSY
ncbi:hypothetical protein TNCT_470691 [Trichonephila clavata]|uniref:Uncharacterized protein n=1 Tax=Trichonephila clavata TaxID=2740835 RepID=A0A8X6HR37_TRICU|nr:hypothetical protein TNCT_470691 [Trichonephila clavata]